MRSAAGNGSHQLYPIAVGELRGGHVRSGDRITVQLGNHPFRTEAQRVQQIGERRAVGEFDRIAVGQDPQCLSLAAAFSCFLYPRTRSREDASMMSATDM